MSYNLFYFRCHRAACGLSCAHAAAVGRACARGAEATARFAYNRCRRAESARSPHEDVCLHIKTHTYTHTLALHTINAAG